MIVDLHAHYPMHVLVRRATQTLRPHHDTFALMLRWGERRWLDRLRAVLLRIANILFNYPRSGKPAVTIPNLRAGGVRVALSVIVVPYDEIGWREVHGAPPAPGSMRHVERQIRWIEKDVARQTGAAIAHDQAQLGAILARGDVALIHAIEGGFLLGDTVAHVRANVRRLAALGVAYVTVAHLFWRRVATMRRRCHFSPTSCTNACFPSPRAAWVNWVSRPCGPW